MGKQQTQTHQTMTQINQQSYNDVCMVWNDKTIDLVEKMKEIISVLELLVEHALKKLSVEAIASKFH